MKKIFRFNLVLLTAMAASWLAPAHAGNWTVDHYKIYPIKDTLNWSRNGQSEPQKSYTRLFNLLHAPEDGQPDRVVTPQDLTDGRITLYSQAQVSGTDTTTVRRSITCKLEVQPIYKWVGDGEPQDLYAVEDYDIALTQQDVALAGSAPRTEANPYNGEYLGVLKQINSFGKSLGPITKNATAPDSVLSTIADEVDYYHAANGATEIPGPKRTFLCQAEIKPYNLAGQSRNLTTFAWIKYKAEVAQFQFNVAVNHPIDVFYNTATKKGIEAYAQRSVTYPWYIENPTPEQVSKFFWDGFTQYSADMTPNLLSSLGNITYKWNNGKAWHYGTSIPGAQTDLVLPHELEPNPSDQTRYEGTIGDQAVYSTPVKKLHHNVGKKEGTRWIWPQQTEVNVLVQGDTDGGTGILQGAAGITWYDEPLTRYETVTTLEVFDHETGAYLPLVNELQNGEVAQIDAEIESIQKAYKETVVTGAKYVKLALETQMMVGSWYVPDEYDLIVPVGGGIAKKFFKARQIVSDLIAITHRVGEPAYAALRATNKWGAKDCSVRVTTVVYRISRGGKLPKGASRTDETMGECGRSSKNYGEGCFVAGTPVLMADGTQKPIESVVVGDMVASRNEATGEVAPRKVSQKFKRISSTLTLTFSNGNVVVTTDEHPFYVENEGFVAARELGIGTSIVTRAGPSATITNVKSDPKLVPVFNFEVDEFHTYFVGRGTFWVHNSCDWVNSVRETTFTGLIQNRNMSECTSNELFAACQQAGLNPSDHFILRLRDSRTSALGMNTLNDFRQLLRYGTPGIGKYEGTLTLTHGQLMLVYNATTKKLISLVPA